MCSPEKREPVTTDPGQSMIVTIIPVAAVSLTLAAAYLGVANRLQTILITTSACILLGLLIRLYHVTSCSADRRALAPVRLHLLLHLVPLVFLLIYLSGANSPWVKPLLVLLLALFFASGRKTWRLLSGLFPSTVLYRIFYRGNSAFLIWFPLLYLASLIVPDFVTFSTIKRVALFYFSIHFMMVGLTSVKIESDLRTRK